MGGQTTHQDELYLAVAAEYGAALIRLARGYEADADQRRDLLQEIHTALWRSFALYEGKCSMRTWVYRVAHNAAVSHTGRRRRANFGRRVGLEDLARTAGADDPERAAGASHALARLVAMIQRLGAPDRQVMLLYLEDLDAAAIGEITGLTAGAVAARVHRLKATLAQRLEKGDFA